MFTYHAMKQTFRFGMLFFALFWAVFPKIGQAMDERAARCNFSAQEPCDTIFFAQNKWLAVKNAAMSRSEISFNLCDDTLNNPYAVGWDQIKMFKKSDGTVFKRAPEEYNWKHKRDLRKQKRLAEQGSSVSSRDIGWLLLVAGLLASVLFLFLWVAVTFADSIPWFIGFGLLGYTGVSLIFKAAFKRLFPKMKKTYRILWAILAPLLVLVLLAAVVVLIAQ